MILPTTLCTILAPGYWVRNQTLSAGSRVLSLTIWTRPPPLMMAVAYGSSRAVTHKGRWNHVHTSTSHAAKPIVLSWKGEKITLIRVRTETLERRTGQKFPAVVSQTVSVK